MAEKYEHELYKHCDEKEADAIAWAFVNKEKMVKFPFKFPPIAKDELRVNVLYAGLCQSDVHTVRSMWGPAHYPIAPGHEIIGEVSLVGSDVKDFKKGDLVGFGTMRDNCGKCKYCKEGKEEICMCCKNKGTYGLYWGGYETQMQQPAKWFFHLPTGFKLEKAAPLFCAGITTYYPIKKYLKPGMKTAVIGIGGLGHMAIQFLHKMGYEVTAFTTSPDKEKLIKELGADSIIISTDKEQMKAAANKFDFIINTLPVSKGFADYVHTCAPFGYFVSVGLPEINESSNTIVPMFEVICLEKHIVGSLVGPYAPTAEMVQLCAEKDIYPMVEIFSFEDFPKAFEKLEHGKPHFRCVVNVKDYAEKHGLKK